MENIEKEVLDVTVVIEQDEDGMYVASVPDIEGCHTQGKDVSQVLERITEAIEVCLEGDTEKAIKPMRFVGLQKVSVHRAPLVAE